MGGSGAPTDYRPEVDRALNQANTPKSDLAQQLSSLFGGMLNGVGGAGAGNNPLFTPGQAFQGQTMHPSGHPNFNQISDGSQPYNPPQLPIGGGVQPQIPSGIGINPPQNSGGIGSGINPSDGSMIQNTPTLNYPGGQMSTQQLSQGNSPQLDSGPIGGLPPVPGIPVPGGSPPGPQLTPLNTTPPAYNPGANPFNNLANMVGQSTVQQVQNAGNSNSILTNPLGTTPNYNQQTQNTQAAYSNNIPGINTNIDQSQAQRLGSNLSGPQTQFQDYGSQVNQALGNFNPHTANLSNVNTQVNAGTPLGTDVNSDYSNAVQQILAQKQNKDIADLRARFGASGGASQGTPAQYAEAELRAQQAPQIAAALGQIRQQESGIDTANRALGVQAQTASGQLGLDSRAQDLNNYQNTQGNILQSLGLGVQNANNLGNLNLGQNQLNSSNQLQNNQLNSQNAQSLLGLQNQFNNTGLNQNAQQLQNQQFNAGQINSTGLQNRGLTLQDLLQQQQYGLGASGLNSQNAQFNTGQTNQLNSNYQQQQQASQEAMFGRDANGNNQLAAYIAALAGAGIPGGSANVNVSPIQNQSGSGLGGTLQGIGSLAQAISSFR